MQLELASQSAERRLGLDDPTTIDCQRWLCRALFESARVEEARVLHAQVLNIARERFGKEHPITQDLMADWHNILGP